MADDDQQDSAADGEQDTPPQVITCRGGLTLPQIGAGNSGE